MRNHRAILSKLGQIVLAEIDPMSENGSLREQAMLRIGIDVVSVRGFDGSAFVNIPPPNGFA